jgi:hypothetical protein
MLKVQWSVETNPFPPMEKLHDHIRAAASVKREEPLKKGDVETAFKAAARVVEAEYEWPFNSHASMGPGCAVADVRADGATLWTGSQKPHYTRDGMAKLVGLPPEKVRAIWKMGPGSYGRNDSGDAAMDAALLSKLTGKPVRVQGMRRDGMWDPKGPACVMRGRAAFDAGGNVTAYDFHSKGFSRWDIATNESDPSDSLAGQEIGLPPQPKLMFSVPEESYGFANKRYAWDVIAPFVERGSPLRTSHLRDPLGPEIQFASRLLSASSTRRRRAIRRRSRRRRRRRAGRRVRRRAARAPAMCSPDAASRIRSATARSSRSSPRSRSSAKRDVSGGAGSPSRTTAA